MLGSKLPTRVPLPEVPHYTEDIVFGGLGLPVGFDQSSLIVNLRSFDRIRKVAGLATVNVFAASSDQEQFDAGITGVGSQGTATVGLAGKRTKKPVASGAVDYHNSALQDIGATPSATIKIDNTEIETRIEEGEKYKKGVFDQQARAKFLNKAIKRGLSEAGFSASFNRGSLAFSAFTYAAWVPTHPFGFTPLESAVLAGPIVNPAISIAVSAWQSMHTGEDMKQLMREFRYSLFAGCTPDRYVAGSELIAASKLIRASK
jgi:hypothetical protein